MGKPPGCVRGAQSSPYASSTPPQQNKNSVLDKFKLFNNKEKNQDRGKASSGVSKRTSSSSGFSSARSEHSDSSTSLCDQQGKQQVESPKSRALKSKLQSAKSAAKQASPKAGRKEQGKGQSKIARTKGGAADKLLVYAAPEDAKPSAKIGATKVMPPPPPPSADKKSSNLHDLLRQQQSSHHHQPLQKAAANPLKQVAGQEKNLAKNESKPRPKMELPAKIPTTDATKIHNVPKIPPNGLSKDVLGQKGLLLSNGMIKQEEDGEEDEETVENDSTIERTLSMNRANMCEQRSATIVEGGKQRRDGGEDQSGAERVQGKGGRVEKGEELEERQTPSCVFATSDAKMTSIVQEATTGAQTNVVVVAAAPSSCHVEQQHHAGVNFGKQHSMASGPLQGSSLIGSPGSSIPKPTALVKGTSKPPKENSVPGVPTPTKLKADALHRKLDPNTVAMVSPMPSISDLMSESSHSNSNSTGQSNSSDSSVIYRPSSESGSEIKTIPNRKIDTTFEQMEKVIKIRVINKRKTRADRVKFDDDFVAGLGLGGFNVRGRGGRRRSGDDGEAYATSAPRLHAGREGPPDVAEQDERATVHDPSFLFPSSCRSRLRGHRRRLRLSERRGGSPRWHDRR